MARGVTLATLPSLLVDVGVAAGITTAILTAAAAVSRLRPIRWVWRRLVTEPMTAWLHATTAAAAEAVMAPLRDQVRAIDHEMHPNGGDGLRDQVDRCVERVDLVAIQVQELRRNTDPGIPD